MTKDLAALLGRYKVDYSTVLVGGNTTPEFRPQIKKHWDSLKYVPNVVEKCHQYKSSISIQLTLPSVYHLSQRALTLPGSPLQSSAAATLRQTFWVFPEVGGHLNSGLQLLHLRGKGSTMVPDPVCWVPFPQLSSCCSLSQCLLPTGLVSYWVRVRVREGWMKGWIDGK